MFCEKCGTDNVAGAKFCAGCGAPLTEIHPEAYPDGNNRSYSYGDTQDYAYREPAYSEPRYDNYAPQHYSGYDMPPQRVVRAPRPQPQRSTGAIVLYIITGFIALMSLAMPFLPQVKYFYYFGSFFNANVPALLLNGYHLSLGASSAESMIFAVMLTAGFAIPAILQLIWAILSFVRVRAAGVLGLIASIIGINVYFIWAAVLKSTRMDATPIPYLMIVLAIAGFVLSIIQLAKKNRVR